MAIGSPAARWKLDETSGSSLNDSSGDVDGYVKGNPQIGAPGLVGGRSVDLDGSGDALIFPTATGGGNSGGGEEQTLMILGDSFSIWQRGFQDAVESELESMGYDVRIINMARGGDETSDGLQRLKDYFDDGKEVPDAAIVALGTNDVTRGREFWTVKKNLKNIAWEFNAKGTEVLIGKPAPYYEFAGDPPNEGWGLSSSYHQGRWTEIYQQAADERGALVSHDFHDGLYVDRTTYLQADEFHPNNAGARLMAENIADEAAELLDRAGGGVVVGGGGENSLDMAAGTVSMWFKPEDLNGNQALFSRDADGLNKGEVSLWLKGGEVRLRAESDSSSRLLKSDPGAVDAGKLHHVAFTFDSQGYELFLDGEEVASRNFSGGWQNNDEHIVIGARTPKATPGTVDKMWNYFNGQIDDVQIFDEALDGADVARIYDEGVLIA